MGRESKRNSANLRLREESDDTELRNLIDWLIFLSNVVSKVPRRSVLNLVLFPVCSFWSEPFCKHFNMHWSLKLAFLFGLSIIRKPSHLVSKTEIRVQKCWQKYQNQFMNTHLHVITLLQHRRVHWTFLLCQQSSTEAILRVGNCCCCQQQSVMCYRLSPAAVKGLGRVPVKATSSYIVIFTTWFVLRWPFVTIVTCGCERVKAGPMSKLLRAIIFMTWLDPLWLTARYNPRTKLLHDKTNSIVNISRVGAQLPEGQEIQELFNETHCTCVTAYIHMGRRLHTL